MKASEATQEVIPPKLNLTAKQLFWVGWAQDFCLLGGGYEYYDKFSDLLSAYWVYQYLYIILIILNNIVQGGAHAPTPWRVNTVISNQEEFAEDFNCPVGAKLNPAERCVVW